MSDYSKAGLTEVDELRQKVNQSPGNFFFRFSLAQLLSKNNLCSEAIEQLCICLEAREDWMMAVLMKAKLELVLGRKNDAADSLSKTIELAKSQGHDDPLAEASHLLKSLN